MESPSQLSYPQETIMSQNGFKLMWCKNLAPTG